MFGVSISDIEEAENHEVMLYFHPLFHEYSNVFPNEILGISLEHDIDFCIDLILGVEPISRALYHMTPQKLSEIILQLESRSIVLTID